MAGGLRELWKKCYLQLKWKNYHWVLKHWSLLHKLYTSFYNWLWSGHLLYVDLDAGEHYYTRESALPAKGPDTARLVVISDTHLYHWQLYVPSGDVLVHAGDCLAEWGHGWRELEDFVAWLKTQPHREKLITGGNHDRIFEELGPQRMAEILATAGARFLHPELFATTEVAAGLVVAGSPWSIRMNPTSMNRAFQPSEDDKRLGPPPRCDVLVTHGPSSVSPVWHSNVQKAGARLHLFGHEHDNYGVTSEDGTTLVNAALCNDAFCAVRRPVVIDITRPRKRQ